MLKGLTYIPLGLPVWFFSQRRVFVRTVLTRSFHSFLPTLADHPWLNNAPPPTIATSSPSHRHCRSPKVSFLSLSLFLSFLISFLLWIGIRRFMCLSFHCFVSSPSSLEFSFSFILFSCGLSLASLNPSFPKPLFIFLPFVFVNNRNALRLRVRV